MLKEQEAALAEKDYADFFDLDEKLHRTFFELANIPSVWKTMNAAKPEMDRIRHIKRMFAIQKGTCGKTVVPDHVAIVTAILNEFKVGSKFALLRPAISKAVP